MKYHITERDVANGDAGDTGAASARGRDLVGADSGGRRFEQRLPRRKRLVPRVVRTRRVRGRVPNRHHSEICPETELWRQLLVMSSLFAKRLRGCVEGRLHGVKLLAAGGDADGDGRAAGAEVAVNGGLRGALLQHHVVAERLRGMR